MHAYTIERVATCKITKEKSSPSNPERSTKVLHQSTFRRKIHALTLGTFSFRWCIEVFASLLLIYAYKVNLGLG